MNRKLKSLSCALISAAMLSTITSPVYAAGLKEVGSFSADDTKVSYGLIYKSDGDQSILCDANGQATDIHYYDDRDRNGFIFLQNVDESANLPVTCMLYPDSALAIPYGPQIISALDNSSRFFEVIYAENKTKDKEKAIMYLTDSIASFQPDDDDTLYEGYKNIYDIETQKEWDIHISSPYDRIYLVGDSFLVKTDEQKTCQIYDDSFNLICEDASAYTNYNNFYTTHEGKVITVYDTHLNKMFDTELSVASLVGGDGRYIKYRDNETKLYGVLNSSGEIVTEAKYEDIYAITGSDYYYISKKDGDKTLYGMLNASFEEIVAPYYTSQIQVLSNGYFKGLWRPENPGPDDDQYSVIDSDGNVLVTSAGNGVLDQFLGCYRKDDDSYSYFVYDKKDFDLTFKNKGTTVGFGILAVQEDDGSMKGAFDLFSGNQILPYEYSKISAAYGKVYAEKDGVITIYEITE